MTLISDDATSRLAFSVAENKGVYAVLVGSGVSRSAKIPTGWEITQDLIRRAAEVRGIESQDDWADWYRSTVGKEPDYSDLLDELATTPAQRRALIQAYVEPTVQQRENGEKTPTAAHKAIAQLVKSGHVRIVVTTNFDRLMENALREIGIEPNVVSTLDALVGAEPLIHSQCYVLKLHGDYKDQRILNTEEELSQYSPPFDTILDRLFDEFGLIVAGWSGDWDEALRAAMVRVNGRRYATFWLAYEEPSDRAVDLIAHRKAIVVKGADADGFFTQLNSKVQTITESRLESPQNIEVLVGLVKGYLAKPVHRIQLDELIAKVTKRLIESLGLLMADMTLERAAYFVTTCEQQIEGLARIATVLGRWGAETEYLLMLDVIKALLNLAQDTQEDNLTLINLRMYPAFLIFNAYGAGLSRASRWEGMGKLVHHSFVLRTPPISTAGSLLGTRSFEASTKAVWNELKGDAGNIAVLSRRMCRLVSQWADSFVGVAHNTKLQFARFEFCCSLNSSEWSERRKSELFQNYAFNATGGLLVLDRELFEELKNELINGGKDANFFTKAGFKWAESLFLERLFENIARQLLKPASVE